MVKVIMLLGIAAQLVGCVSQPAPQLNRTVAPSTAGPTGTGDAAVTTAAGQAKQAAPPGFKPRVRKGQTVYCRTSGDTGSHFPKEECYTLEAAEKLLEMEKISVRRILNKPPGQGTREQ